MDGDFNIPNMSGTLTSRNSSMNSVVSSGVQQQIGNVPGGRFASNNIPIGLSQISHGSSHGEYSRVANTGGLGVSPFLGNTSPQATSSMGNIVGSDNIGMSIGSDGGLYIPGLASHLNMSANNGFGSLGVQGPNRFNNGVLQQDINIMCCTKLLWSVVDPKLKIKASPQVLTVFGNSYPSSGVLLSQNHAHTMNNLSSMGSLSDENSNDISPFTLNDFPQLGSLPNSAGGPLGQLSSPRKQGLGGPIVQLNQEFTIRNEDFPALPGFKGGNSDYGMDFQQKEQIHDNGVPMLSQHFPMGRSPGFNSGEMYSSHHPQQQQQHTLSDSLPAGTSLTSINTPGGVSNSVSYEQQFMHPYQYQQIQLQFPLQQMQSINQTNRDLAIRQIQSQQPNPDPYGFQGLLSVIRMSDCDLTLLALGIDLKNMGLDMNLSENVHETCFTLAY